ncbi:hypothetical protein [Paenibacillus eucommiae]|uniref:Ribosomal protein L12E/L44/L45/RPP1/RPP2 n=1 Tax=Paenibacillus eucommiae TaxID=1355755 RepID=A0ABS4J7H3_9BACL|nr:hypothetical protein [Paenibacillus eucommiae]MBP1995051.1 ribosomal protein L12E/L44/L45/RPP1/RPP2 [Paenibacillus eucommiae]
MKKKTVWASAVIAMMVAIPGVSVFAATDLSMPSATTPHEIKEKGTAFGDKGERGNGPREGDGQGRGQGKGKGPGKGGSHDGSKGAGQAGLKGVHGEEYLLLLTEKYAPDQLSGFKSVFEAQNLLEEQIKTLRDADKAAIEAIKAKVESGELTQEQADEQIKQLREANKPVKPEAAATDTEADTAAKAEAQAAAQAKKEASKALHDEFETAVQTLVDSGDTAQITQVLPKLLEDLKVQNERLSEQLTKLQTKAAEASAGVAVQ